MYMLQVNKTITHMSISQQQQGKYRKKWCCNTTVTTNSRSLDCTRWRHEAIGDEESINRNRKPCNANGCNVRVYIFRNWITWWILTVALWLASYTRRMELLDPNSQAKANFAHVGTAHSSGSCPETNLQILFLTKFKSWIVQQYASCLPFFSTNRLVGGQVAAKLLA